MILGSSNINNYEIEYVGAIAGVLSIILYISAVAFSFLPDSVSRLFAFTFPLLWIISFLGLYRFLSKDNFGASLQIAFLFGIIGGALACALLVIQQANIIWYQDSMNTAQTEEAKQMAKTIFFGVDKVQSAMDVAFDIFITLSWVLFGLNIAGNKNFNSILGYSGSSIAFGLLLLNLYTFPNAPSDSGLLDLGPFLGIWALILYLSFFLKIKRLRNTQY
ncbi:MAG: hypothetical protein AAGF96_03045 [Bacteroidota bacterium]